MSDGIDYKELLLKYIAHIKFYEGEDYLSEGYIHGSPSLNDYDLMLIQDLIESAQ